jgi:hypothetical protein
MNFRVLRRIATPLALLFPVSHAQADGGRWHEYFSGAQAPAHHVRLKMTMPEPWAGISRDALGTAYKICMNDVEAKLPESQIPDTLYAAVVEIYYGTGRSVSVENIEQIIIPTGGKGKQADCSPRKSSVRKINLMQYPWTCTIEQWPATTKVSAACKQAPPLGMGIGLARFGAAPALSTEQKLMVEAWERKQDLRMPPNLAFEAWSKPMAGPMGERRVLAGRECRVFGHALGPLLYQWCIVAAPAAHKGAQSGLLLGVSPFQVWPGVLLEGSIEGFDLRLIDVQFDAQVSEEVFKIPDTVKLPPLQKGIL